MSVPEAAAHLGVSEARVRQRIGEGSLVAEKVGGRWLLDLGSIDAAARPARGRPVSPLSVWYSMLALDATPLVEGPKVEAPNIDFVWPSVSVDMTSISPSSRSRAVQRLASALAHEDHDALLAWLSNRGERHLYVAANADLGPLREDDRLVPSGVSHPDSNMSDPRVAEGYVAKADLEAIVRDYWLEAISLDDKPNVILHAVPARPPQVSRLLLAADLAEHGTPRELVRAHELLDEVIREHAGQP